MRNVWKLKYGSHNIQVENTWMNDKLYVDGVLQDEQVGFHLSSRLLGKVQNEDGEPEDIKISIAVGCPNTRARIFIGEKLVYSTDLQWDM